MGETKNAQVRSAPRCSSCGQLMTPRETVPDQRRLPGTQRGAGFRRPQTPPQYVCWNDDCFEFGIYKTLPSTTQLPITDAD